MTSTFGLMSPKPFPSWSVAAAEFVWIQASDDAPSALRGLAIEAQKNLTNRERKALRTQFEEIAAEAQRIIERSTATQAAIAAELAAATDADDPALSVATIKKQEAFLAEREAALDANRWRVQEALAPFIRDWNLSERGSDGEWHEAPPPMKAGPDAFEALSPAALFWIRDALLLSYRWGLGFGGKVLSSSSETSDASPEPTNGSDETTLVAELPAKSSDRSRPSRKKSPTPSTSVSPI